MSLKTRERIIDMLDAFKKGAKAAISSLELFGLRFLKNPFDLAHLSIYQKHAVTNRPLHYPPFTTTIFQIH